MSDSRQILVIDDDRMLCELLRTTFELEGFEVSEAHHVIEAERVLVEARPAAIVLDIGLPGIDGLFYCERLRESPHTSAVPIVVISGSDEAGLRAAAAGANGFLRKPFNPLELVALVQAKLGLLPLERAVDPERNADLAHAADLRRLIEIGHRQHELLDQAYRQTVSALAAALESRDFGTSEHSRRVTAYATRLALDVAPSLLDDPSLEWGFMLHDVGKIGIPDRILLKSGRLSEGERGHDAEARRDRRATAVARPARAGRGAARDPVAPRALGRDGLSGPAEGDEIPLGARIFAAVDSLDAMTDHRPYRLPMSWDAAMFELQQKSEHQFDPDVIEAINICEPDMYRIYRHQIAA